MTTPLEEALSSVEACPRSESADGGDTVRAGRVVTEIPLPLEPERHVTPNLKTNKGACEGVQASCNAVGCPLYGALGRVCNDGGRRVQGCNDPAARGRRNRRKGDDKARKARKVLGLAGPNTRHEELWAGALLTEAKAGAAGGANKVWTAYRNARDQSDASRAFGDPRPFVASFAPDGTSHVLFVVRDDDLVAMAFALVEQWGAA